MTQTPALHSTPLAPGMLVQSTPPAPTHPPHDSTFSFVSTHSNVAFNPGIGHLVYLGLSQGTSRRTRRDRPEAATVFAVAAGRKPRQSQSQKLVRAERGKYARQVPPDDWLQDETPLWLFAEQAEADREPGAEP